MSILNGIQLKSKVYVINKCFMDIVLAMIYCLQPSAFSVPFSLFHSCKPNFACASFKTSGSNFLKTISLALRPVGERLWGSKSVDAEEDRDAVWVANAANDCVELWYLQRWFTQELKSTLLNSYNLCTRLQRLKIECGTVLADKLLYWSNLPP